MLSLLSSLRLAVVVMVTLGSMCAFATFYEMRHGTPAVQRDIYQTWWFAALLGLLGLNVFSVMVSRYPWTKHHIGFLTAHVGILARARGLRSSPSTAASTRTWPSTRARRPTA